MNLQWDIFIDLGIISLALLIATFIRSKVKFFQRFLIPNSLTAGFLLLPFYNYLAGKIGLGTMNLENIVSHFLNISFIAMTLRVSEKRRSKGMRDILATANSLLVQYGLQCFLGLLLCLGMIYTFYPRLFPGFGLFPTLGFSLGPGQAFSIASAWEGIINDAVAGGANVIFDYKGLGDIGLTFGALGFLWASFGGVYLVNYGIRKGWINKENLKALNKKTVRSGIQGRGDKNGLTDGRNITSPEAIDPITFNLALVLLTYLATYFFMKLFTGLLMKTGNTALMQLAPNLWGIMFIFCALMAVLVKLLLQLFKIEYIVDNQRMNRISGFSVDLMVASAIGAISIAVVVDYWVPILIIAVVVGLVTTITHIWLSSRIFTDHVFFRSILVYGCATGTLPTGLALLRIIDPHFETPASRDYTYAASFVFLFAIPILATANMTVLDALDGKLFHSWWLLGMYGLYVVFCFLMYLLISGKRRFKDPARMWLKRSK